MAFKIVVQVPIRKVERGGGGPSRENKSEMRNRAHRQDRTRVRETQLRDTQLRSRGAAYTLASAVRTGARGLSIDSAPVINNSARDMG